MGRAKRQVFQPFSCGKKSLETFRQKKPFGQSFSRENNVNIKEVFLQISWNPEKYENGFFIFNIMIEIE